MIKKDYVDKFNTAIKQIPMANLTSKNKNYLERICHAYFLTFQEIRILTEITIDLQMWKESELQELWPIDSEIKDLKHEKEIKLKKIQDYWNDLKNQPNNYDNFQVEKSSDKTEQVNIKFLESPKSLNEPILGQCPVASEKTLCCNLQTLDAVNNCGFACSYCSIQSFFPDNTIVYEKDILKKLSLINFDKNQIYHIGTGQSSDSLMWGNKEGILDQLMTFAKNNPNIILEFKTKSKNISFFLENEIPRNIICTWSISPQTIIDYEEHRTASLTERLSCAHQLTQKGILVGFHFHPMVHYDEYQNDYNQIAKNILQSFTPELVALISIGTLTFTKPVLKEIRRKKSFSKILQMPLVDANGKMSYPTETKIEMFKFLYDQFLPWHNKTFFYLCMEDITLWKPVFGFDYENNLELERAMKKSYMDKILRNSSHGPYPS